MKKIITLALALVMCIGTFASFSAFAANDPEYIFYENFNNMAENPTQSKCFGIKAFNSYASSAALNNGKFEFTNAGDAADGQGFLDWQLWMSNGTVKKLSESFTFFTEIKLTGDWSDINQPMFNFGYYSTGDSATRIFFDVVRYNKGTLEMGTATATPVADAYNTYEFSFTYEGGKYTKVELYLNGTKVGETDISDKNLTAIDRIRSFTTWSAGPGVSVDSFAFVKGAQSIYGTQIPDTPAEVVVQVPTLPTVNASDKSEVTYFYHEDYNTIAKEELNAGATPGSVSDANGFWLALQSGATEDNFSITEDGTLKMDGATMIDFQFYGVNKWKVKEDFVMSFKIKPYSSGMNGVLLEGVRRDSQGTWDNTCRIDITDGHIMHGSKDCGLLPVNEWTLIELVFDYDDEKGEFTTFKLMLNGTVVSENTLNPDAMLLQVKHFRMLRYFASASETFELDDFNVISGNKSVIYALDYVAPSTPEGTTPEGTTPEGTTPEGTTPDATTPDGSDDSASNNKPADTASTTTAPKATETEAPAEEKKGCSSSITLGAFAMMSVIGIAGGFALRKKED